MRFAAAGFLSSVAAALLLVSPGIAQDWPRAAPDPRVGLKAGFRDAGIGAANIELVATVPRPEGFFDPRNPAGLPTPSESSPEEERAREQVEREHERAGTAPPPLPGANNMNFANSDLAFAGSRVFVGNFHGFTIYDIGKPERPRHLASVVCPGGQGDVSVHGNLLFMSVEQTRGRIDCGTAGVRDPISAERFRGVRIFDISDVRRPRQVAAVQTCRGSHTHTLVADPDDAVNVYVYGSGTGRVRSVSELAECSGLDPERDPNTALFSIDVIQVPLAAPENARIVNRPRIFADPVTGDIAGLWKGGDHGPGTQRTPATNRCHDLTVFPALGLAAGACAGNGILLDISDPIHPVRLDQAVDRSFAFWHSATFNNDGSKVIFTDEWGGGTRPRCRATDPPTWGANAIFDVVDRTLRFSGYYKLPAAQTDQENCVAHNGSLIPVPGRDIFVQAWYQGGVSIFDFTDSAKPFEIAFFDRGPIDAKQLITGGHWSAYWYRGRIYATEIARGLDVFALRPSQHLSQNEIDAAMLASVDEFNAQQQQRFTWPAASVVARAYVDQLTRTHVLDAQQAAALRALLNRADRLRPGEAGAADVLSRLEAYAAQFDSGSAVNAIDRSRLRALAETVRGISAARRDPR
jgi:hypothetical protein